MSIFALSDLHLSLSTDKSMEVFYGWENYTERIKANWKRLIKNEDTVVISGDVSWGISLEEALEDFKFINDLPGKKIIIKGNHDFWWTTMKKMQEFLRENCFDSIEILHNNSVAVGEYAVCGTRGWVYDGSGEKDEKVISRECARLETSIKDALTKNLMPIVFLHYPPFYNGYQTEGIIEVLRRYGINQIYYGHIHGNGMNFAPKDFEEIKMRLISCDCVDFTPVFIA